MLGLAFPGCAFSDFDNGPTPDDVEVGSHDLRGELMLFTNTRLTDTSSQYSSHLLLDEPGTFRGSALYLYDPAAVCDDGTSACKVARLGYLQLDDAMGSKSVQDGSLRKFATVDLAYHPVHGLWALAYDPQNDEWSIVKIEVPDWTKTNQLLPVQRWTILPGDPESPATDPCYWQEATSGLEFLGDDLLLGVRGIGGKGLSANGQAFRIRLDVATEQGHCIYPGDITQDPLYYACDVLCETWCDFGYRLGVAGDLIASADDAAALAWTRSEDESVFEFSRNAMYACDPSTANPPTEAITAESVSIFLDEVIRGDEIEGMARIDGVLFGISTLGKIYEIDEATRTVTQIDDVLPLFPPQGLKARGATTVNVPAGPGEAP